MPIPETEPLPSRPADSALQEIDDLLNEVSRLSQSDSTPEQFHLELLERAVRALAAVAGVVWIRSDGGHWRADSRIDQSRQQVVETLCRTPQHVQLLQSVVDADHGRIVFPHAAQAGDQSPNPTDYLLIVCPILIGGNALASAGMSVSVLEIAQRPGGSPAQHQGYLRLLGALCELAADFHRLRRVRGLQAMADKVQAFERFGLDVHASLDLTATATAVVNEGRRIVECDRLSVAVWRGQRLRIRAVSGLDELDPRANIIHRLEDLAHAVVLMGEPFWNAGDNDQVAPQIAQPLQAWRDESHARSVVVVPLASELAPTDQDDLSKPFGALIFERFGGVRFDDANRLQIDTVGRHAELALRNALEHESLPFYPMLRALQKSGWFLAARQLPKTVGIALAVAAVVVALVLIPADFSVEGRGQLQPELRRNVFARSDGIVTDVRTEHSRDCQEGDVLAVMTRSQLDFETSRVLGEQATVRKRLSSVQASRLRSSPQTAAEREKYNQLTAEETELQESLKSVDQQLEILKSQQDDLLVRSPVSGTVVTWNVRQLLEARPVQKGQVLLQVADLSGPWVLDVEIPDDHMGHVLNASERSPKPLEVTFMLATEAGTSYRGTIEKISLGTDVRQPEQAHVPITVRINRDEIHGLRPNATAAVRIHCGRRSIGFVWFHHLWETIQKKVLF